MCLPLEPHNLIKKHSMRNHVESLTQYWHISYTFHNSRDTSAVSLTTEIERRFPVCFDSDAEFSGYFLRMKRITHRQWRACDVFDVDTLYHKWRSYPKAQCYRYPSGDEMFVRCDGPVNVVLSRFLSRSMRPGTDETPNPHVSRYQRERPTGIWHFLPGENQKRSKRLASTATRLTTIDSLPFESSTNSPLGNGQAG